MYLSTHIIFRIASFEFFYKRRHEIESYVKHSYYSFFIIGCRCLLTHSVCQVSNLQHTASKQVKTFLFFFSGYIKFYFWLLGKKNYWSVSRWAWLWWKRHYELLTIYMCFPHIYFLGSLRHATAGLIFLRLPPKEFSTLILLVPIWSPWFTLTRECGFLESKRRPRPTLSVTQFVSSFISVSYSSYCVLKHRYKHKHHRLT